MYILYLALQQDQTCKGERDMKSLSLQSWDHPVPKYCSKPYGKYFPVLKTDKEYQGKTLANILSAVKLYHEKESDP